MNEPAGRSQDRQNGHRRIEDLPGGVPILGGQPAQAHVDFVAAPDGKVRPVVITAQIARPVLEAIQMAVRTEVRAALVEAGLLQAGDGHAP